MLRYLIDTYHVIRSLARMPEWDVLWDDPVEHHLHVVPHVRVPVLVDGETGGRVQQLDVHQANGELRQLGKLKAQLVLMLQSYVLNSPYVYLSQYLLRDQMDAPVLGPEVNFPLQPGGLADDDAAGGPARRGRRS